MPREVLDRLRDVVLAEPGLTLAGLLREAAEREIRRRERERGAPFPRRGEARIKTGRPIGGGADR